MLQLYFWPMACSLAARIALMEAGIEARYHLTDIWTKKVMEDGGDFFAVSAKGAVPVLVTESGEKLTENAAVLQYIADLRPELGLAPPPGDADRYRLQEWLSFVGSEIHKGFLFPTFWCDDDAVKACVGNGSARPSRSLRATSRTASSWWAMASLWPTPIWRGRCCCFASVASMSVKHSPRTSRASDSVPQWRRRSHSSRSCARNSQGLERRQASP